MGTGGILLRGGGGYPAMDRHAIQGGVAILLGILIYKTVKPQKARNF